MRFFIAFAIAAAVVVAADAGPSYTDHQSAYACRIESGGRTTGPSADICEQVVRRWRLLLGIDPVPGEIRLVTTLTSRGSDFGGSWILEWAAAPKNQKNQKPTDRRKKDGLASHTALNIIPHEAGHHIFNNYVSIINTPSDGRRYGTLAPDWIDEAPAVWMESRSEREQRMRGLAHSSPSLARLVTMEHPAREFATENTSSAPGVRSATNPNRGTTTESRQFYGLSYSLLRFIRVRGGVGAVQELIGRYRDNPTARVEVFASLPGLPSTVQEFEQAWIQFLRNPPPEDQ